MSKILLALVVLSASTAIATPVIREETTVVVKGHRETWRLEWRSEPTPNCITLVETAPECHDFAYGEAGDLDLVRIVDGHEVDRLPLTPLFRYGLGEYDDEGEPVRARLRRWPTQPDDDPLEPSGKAFASIQKRQSLRIMELGDYNRDGHATEFILIVGAQRDRRPSVAVGLDRRQDKLRAFTTEENRQRPLVLWSPKHWEALKQRGKLQDWLPCDAVAVDTVDLTVKVDGKGLHAFEELRNCENLPKAPKRRHTL